MRTNDKIRIDYLNFGKRREEWGEINFHPHLHLLVTGRGHRGGALLGPGARDPRTVSRLCPILGRNRSGLEPRPYEIHLLEPAPDAGLRSFDGKYLFFTSMEPGKGNGDIYWVDASVPKR